MAFNAHTKEIAHGADASVAVMGSLNPSQTATSLGIPLSATTHTITGAIVGVGAHGRHLLVVGVHIF